MRTLRNTGTTDVGIPCTLYVPAGHTTVPLEHAGLQLGAAGQLALRRLTESGDLQVIDADDVDDRAAPPVPAAGSISVVRFFFGDGAIVAGNTVRITASSIPGGGAAVVTVAGQSVLRYTATREGPGDSPAINCFEPYPVGARFEILGVSDTTFTDAGTPYRACIARWINKAT